MAASIYTLFRSFIGDSTPDYSVADTELLTYLDAGIDKASQVLNYIVKEDVTITESDISNGYIDLSNEVVGVLSNDLWVDSNYIPWNTTLGAYGENVYWQLDGGKRIRFIDSDYISAGDYVFTYKAKYKKFDGVVRDDDYFDFDNSIDLGIVFWALSLYQSTKGITDVDGEAVVMSKAEEGMSVSYDNVGSQRLSSPAKLQKEAMNIFINANNHTNINFSVTV